MKPIIKYGVFALISVVLFSFDDLFEDSPNYTPYELNIPEGFPNPVMPEDNYLSQERVDLGRMLFYDPILSIDSTVSCASCHDQSLAFADNKVISPGVENRLAARNAPTLTNVVYNPTVLFDAYLPTLEMQVLVPVQEHAEMAFNIVEIGKRLRKDSVYIAMSMAAYGKQPNPYVITRSISAFERTLISGNSKYDREVFQKKKAMNPSQRRGMNIFNNRLYCAECHSGFNFTNFSTQNNGLYLNYPDSGRARATQLPEDRAMFKIPTLRNIELTAPYMHDGSLATLNDVIDHYASGGQNHENKSEIIQPFKISKREKRDLINFLKSLTDYDFITNPDFSTPFK